MDEEQENGVSRGLGVISYDKLRSSKFWMCSRIKSTISKLIFVVINIYGKNSIQVKRKVYIDISNFMEDFPNQNFIIGGNFNAVMSMSEKWGGITRESHTTMEFKEWVNKNEMMEIKFENDNYTWINR